MPPCWLCCSVGPAPPEGLAQGPAGAGGRDNVVAALDDGAGNAGEAPGVADHLVHGALQGVDVGAEAIGLLRVAQALQKHPGPRVRRAGALDQEVALLGDQWEVAGRDRTDKDAATGTVRLDLMQPPDHANVMAPC